MIEDLVTTADDHVVLADTLHMVESVGNGTRSASEVLPLITASALSSLVGATLRVKPDAFIATGESRAPGVAVGMLALTPTFAKDLMRRGIPYVLGIENADVTNFGVIKSCAGFFSGSPAQTAFGPVQAVSHGKPTLIGVPYRSDGARATFTLRTGQARTVAEGEWVSLDCVTGALYEGRVERMLSPVAEFYELSWACIERAVSAGNAETYLTGLHKFPELLVDSDARERINALAQEPAVRGYWMLLEEARKRSKLDVWVSAHTADAIGRAQFLTALVAPDGQEGVRFTPAPVHVGLMRDERMWLEDNEQEILRLLILGPDVVRQADWASTVKEYSDLQVRRLTRLLAEARGGRVILRALCMPYAKLFNSERDADRLAPRCEISREGLRARLAGMNEMEMYQGCRGMRLLTQHPDIAELWLRAALTATRQVAASGEATRLRILLPTITLPEEARRFLDIVDRVTPEILGEEHIGLLDGVSIMIETGGAYLLAEDFLRLSSEVTSVDGAMFGSNDFTAAMFSVNREDSTRTIFPGYVRASVLPSSPFAQLDKVLVGRAIQDVLSRIGSGDNAYLIGLGGELAGEWNSVRWLADETSTRGFSYVTTGPETVLRSLFAAAGSAQSGSAQ